MISKKGTVIVSVCAGLTVLAVGMFGIYKHFVTPERIVALTMINAAKDAEKSLNFCIDEDEAEVISKVVKKGGKTELNFDVSNSLLFDGASFSITGMSNGRETVSKININDIITLDAYKNNEKILINLPLMGGIEIPMNDFAKQWNSSIFKDIITLPESGDSPAAVAGTAAGIIGLAYTDNEFTAELGRIVKKNLERNPIKKTGTKSVVAGNKSERAKVYRTRADKECVDEIKELVQRAAQSMIEKDNAQLAEQINESLNGEYELEFAIDDFTLRELNIISDTGDVYTVALEGRGNVFSNVALYKNNDTGNAVRRTHIENSGGIVEEITAGQNNFRLENSVTSMKAKLSADGWDTELTIAHKNVTDDSVSYSGVELNLGGVCTLSGDITMTDEKAENLSFNIASNYINLLEISPNQWERLVDIILKGVGLFK